MATMQQSTGTLYNALTAGSKITGTVETENDMRIDGVIDGDVKCSSKLVVGEHGRINGNVQCQNAEIMGKIDGSIVVTYSLALRSTGVITGDIVTQTLVVEPNAMFEGTCKMAPRKQASVN